MHRGLPMCRGLSVRPRLPGSEAALPARATSPEPASAPAAANNEPGGNVADAGSGTPAAGQGPAVSRRTGGESGVTAGGISNTASALAASVGRRPTPERAAAGRRPATVDAIGRSSSSRGSASAFLCLRLTAKDSICQFHQGLHPSIPWLMFNLSASWPKASRSGWLRVSTDAGDRREQGAALEARKPPGRHGRSALRAEQRSRGHDSLLECPVSRRVPLSVGAARQSTACQPRER